MANLEDWKPVRRVVVEYTASLQRLVSRWSRLIDPAQLADVWSEPSFLESCEELSRQMAHRILNTNARGWRAAARKASNGRVISNALRHEMQGPVGRAVAAIIRQNARLIRSVPLDMAEQAAAYIGEMQREGFRSSVIARELRRQLPHLTDNRIRLIARTEVGKAETAITQARAEGIGVRFYEWRTSEDSRVRLSHRRMDGVLVAWSDPPSPERLNGERSTLGHYPPGGAPNCRCLALPLIDLDEVKWPHRLYRGGSIQNITRANFSRLAGIKRAA